MRHIRRDGARRSASRAGAREALRRPGTATGGAAQLFTVYFRANLTVEKPLSPPLVIPGSSAVTVSVDPSLWFNAGTQVLNLAALNGQTVGFGGEIEHDEGGHGSGHD
jgi:hypothetical protein